MIHRRRFLGSLVALGVAGAADAALASDSFAESNELLPHPLVLKSGVLNVVFSGKNGLPSRYEFAGGGIDGAENSGFISAILCRLHPRAYQTVSLHVTGVSEARGDVVFHCELMWEKQVAVRYSLRYSLRGAMVIVTTEDVVESAGFELIEIALPNLASVRATDKAAWLAQGRDGGSFVRVAEAKPFTFSDDDNFGRISTQLPIGMVGADDIGCLMEVTAFMDGTETAVVETAGERRARIGTVQVYRVHGGRCYNMNDGTDGVCGTAETPNLLVGQTSRCTLEFYKVEDAKTPWFAGAKLLRSRMPKTPTHYFDDKLLYLIAGRSKVEPEPRTTFVQSEALIGDVARLTDFAPQLALISGWVYDGQDTGYPSEDVVNSSLGGYERLTALMSAGPRYNANVSVNVNYDDAYKSSPEFNLDFIAREPNGAVWKSRPWDGEDSYIVGMAKYVAGGWAERRIAKSVSRYKVHDAMLIDALSWYTIRNDWDPKHPASGYRNLVDGKWVVIEEFRKRGVHVASEQFRYPMLGKLALTVNGPEPATCPFGGEQIPLTAIVYRKATIFGDGGEGKLRPQENLFWNCRPGIWYEHKTDRRTITDFYYLVVLPYNKVHRLDVLSYGTHGATRELVLERDSKVVVDSAGPGYEVVWKGSRIAKDETTTCPVDEKRIAFYSRRGGPLSCPLPAHWNAVDVVARVLTVDGRHQIPLKVESGTISVEMAAQMPVMIYASAGAIAAVGQG